eukprot:COSAG05_NODE_3281_length_2180_cov_1.518020_2_plen_115_part_00
MVLLRKLALTLTGSLAITGGKNDSTTQCWYFGSGITVLAIAMHAAARPFYDELADITEFFSLASMLLLFQSGIVFKLINDPTDPRLNPANFDTSPKDGAPLYSKCVWRVELASC